MIGKVDRLLGKFREYDPAVESVPVVPVYGYLYNWKATLNYDAGQNIVNESSGFKMPGIADYLTLANYIQPGITALPNNVGNYLKESGLAHWQAGPTENYDLLHFNARGVGIRQANGNFESLKQRCFLWQAEGFETYGHVVSLFYNDNSLGLSMIDGVKVLADKNSGCSIRLIKEFPSSEDLLKSDGEYCENYKGNDGKTYRTVKIGTQVWLADHLAETKYSNLVDIYIVEDSSEWAAITTPAMCAYGNDPINAVTPGTGTAGIVDKLLGRYRQRSRGTSSGMVDMILGRYRENDLVHLGAGVSINPVGIPDHIVVTKNGDKVVLTIGGDYIQSVAGYVPSNAMRTIIGEPIVTKENKFITI